MILKIEATVDGQEVIDSYLMPKLKESNVTPDNKDIKVQVQNKAGEFIDVSPDKVKFVFNK